MAAIIPFPQNRRRHFIARHAARMATLPGRTAEGHLAYTLRVQAETMDRRGIERHRIELEIKALERAIREQFWRIIEQGDRA